MIMSKRKFCATLLCLVMFLALIAVPSYGMTIQEGLKLIVKAEDNIIDAAYQNGFDILHMEIDTIRLGDSYTLTRTLNAGTGYEAYGVGVGITQLKIQILDSKKKVVAENSGEQPDVNFIVKADGDYDIVVSCDELNQSNSQDSDYYFFLALATQPKK